MKKEETKDTMNEEAESCATPEEQETTEAPVDDWKDKYVRLYADFDNYKKRMQKEMTASYSNGSAYVAEKLLPVMDNFERAIAAEGVDLTEGFGQGVNMIFKQLSDVLSELGVTPIEAIGKSFDPNFHNAVMHIDDENYGESEVVEEFIKGYMIKDKVLRHSVVKVAN